MQKSRTDTYNMGLCPCFYPILMECLPGYRFLVDSQCVGVCGDSKQIQAECVLSRTKEVDVGGGDVNSPKRSRLPLKSKLASNTKGSGILRNKNNQGILTCSFFLVLLHCASSLLDLC